MRRRPGPGLPLLLLGWVLLAPLAAAAEGRYSWAYLIEKLVRDGLDRERVLRVFDDPRLPAFTGLEFGLYPREPASMYRHFLRPSSVEAARRCLSAHASVLQSAERTYGVPASVVAAILHVETGCGRNQGSSIVFHRLARLAMANEPSNLADNIDRLTGFRASDPELEEQVRTRARYLEDTFYPEVRAAFEVADRLNVDPLALRGSASGALGSPQFLPSNYLRFGIDAEGDGRVDIFDTTDGAISCANYLAAKGWQPGLSESERRRVIWQYNHSGAYVEAVLALAHRLEEPPARVWSRARVTRKGRGAPAKAVSRSAKVTRAKSTRPAPTRKAAPKSK